MDPAITRIESVREAKHIYCYWATVANLVPSCYRFLVVRFDKRAPALRAISVAALVGAAAAACSRSGLEDLGATPFGPGDMSPTPDGAASTRAAPVDATVPPPDAFVDAAIDATIDATVDGAKPPTTSTSTPPPPKPTSTSTAPPPPGCTPHDETCNGVDDDCNGEVDDGIAAVPCPGGGERFCVAGRFSACPTRCETCIPGSERICFLSYCTYWAAQTCAADGRSFGVCRERHVPPECDGVATKQHDSAPLEQCCIDKGYCCRDEFDLDHDGNRSEMLGKCDEVSCQ
jgi:hypothetical protein